MNLGLTLENVLVRLEQKEVMERFFGQKVVFGKRYCNPFREDKNPKCFFRMIRGVLTFCDFASNYWGDCISICSYRLGIGIYPALQYLNKEYNLGLGYDDNEIVLTTSPVIDYGYSKSSVKEEAKIVFQRYEDFEEVNYFTDYHITNSTLKLFNVIPVHKVWIETSSNTEVFTSSNSQPIFVYDFGNSNYKVYRPCSKPSFKWRSNCKELQGYTGDTDELVIRTSSLKDVMVLYECGYIADAPHCENGYAKHRSNMILLYDNDTAGVKFSQKHSEYYNCPYILLPEVYVGDKLLKDPSDFAKEFGLDHLKIILQELIGNAIRSRISTRVGTNDVRSSRTILV